MLTSTRIRSLLDNADAWLERAAVHYLAGTIRAGKIAERNADACELEAHRLDRKRQGMAWAPMHH